MNYIDEIFERADIQHIREFLLSGMECIQTSPKSYQQRLNEAWEPVDAVIKSKFPDEKEQEKIFNEITRHAAATQDVYTEIGLQCGAILAARLLGRPRSQRFGVAVFFIRSTGLIYQESSKRALKGGDADASH